MDLTNPLYSWNDLKDAASAWEFGFKTLVWGIHHSLLCLKAGSLKVFVAFKASNMKFDREEAVLDNN